MTREELIAKIHELGLAPFETEILGLVRPCLNFYTTVATSPAPVTRSKLGGTPELPAGMTWPFSQPTVPMVFLGRIVGADLARIHPHLAQQNLLFFGDWNYQMTGKIISIPVDTPVFPLETPTFPEEMRCRSALKECDLHFSDAVSIPDSGEEIEKWRYSEALRTHGGKEKTRWDGQIYLEYPLRELWATHFGQTSDRDDMYRLFGYPIFVQGHPAYAAEQTFTRHPSYGEISMADFIQKAAQWQSVISLPTDYTAGLTYGDTGSCGFLVTAADLAAGQFSAAEFYADSM